MTDFCDQHAPKPSELRADWRTLWLIIALCALGALWPLSMAMRWWSAAEPNDFTYFWEAGQAALGIYPVSEIWFPYPPHALFFYAPFGMLPYLVALAVYNFYGLACFLLAARRFLPPRFPPLLAICSPAALTCVLFGQTGLFVGALWLWAFSGKWQAVALLTIKPHLGILSALSLSRKTVLPTAALAAFLILASIPVFWEWWPQFFAQVSKQTAGIGQSAKWNVIAVGPAFGYGLLGWMIFAGAGLLLLSRNVTPFSAATAALLVSPYGFHYDMPVASLGFLLGMYCAKSPARTFIFAAALMIPIFVRFGAWMAPPILLCALWSQTVGREFGEPPAQSAT